MPVKKALVLFLTFLSFNAFSQKAGILTGPSGIPCGFMIENKNASFEVFPSAQALVPKLIKGEIDMGFLPPNLAAKIYNTQNQAVKILAITGNGNLSLLSNNPEIKTFSDLTQKKAACAGMGATPEYITRFLLEKNNVTNVELDFSTPNPQLPALLAQKKFECAIMPEPFSTVALSLDSQLFKVTDLQSEYKKITGTDFPLTVLVVRSAYYEKNKKKVAEFLKNYKKSQEWTMKNPEKAGVLCQKHNIGLKSEIASKAIPECNFTFLTGNKCQTEIQELLSVFLSFDKNSIGAKLPDDNFYIK